MRVEVSPCPFSSSFLPFLSAPPSTGSSILPLSNFIITSGNMLIDICYICFERHYQG